MKKRYNGKSKWIPLFLCVCLFISLIVPFIPGVLAEEEETTQAVADREMVYPLACFTTQTSSQPPLVQNDTGISPFFWAVVSPSVSDPMEGYAYRFPNGDDYENFFYCRGDWYYLGSGTQQTFYGISIDPLGTPAADSFTYNEAIIIDPSKAIAMEDLDTLAPKTVEITWENRVDDSLTIEYAEKQTLSAHPDGFLLPSYQWQILLNAEADIWVNIADKTEADCEVSYALVKNMLDAANSAYLRCAVTDATETVYSSPVCVAVKPEAEFDGEFSEPAPMRTAATPLSQPKKGRESYDALLEVSPALGTGSGEEYVTITIQYRDYVDNSKAVFSPYVATILKDSAFVQQVVSPTLVGFAPYYDNDPTDDDPAIDDPADSIQFNNPEVGADIEIMVYYKPVEVTFAVKFFFQNILDDLYTEDTSRYATDTALTGTAITNERLAELAVTPTTGFTNLYHVPENVAADGSTVFEVYYDRNYYLIQFDLDGGYGVEPIYARYGATFVVNDPVKAGYEFDHWELIYIDANDNGVWDAAEAQSGTSGLVSSVPEHNYYYRAIWRTVTSQYTTVYWLEHRDYNSEPTSFLGSKIDYVQSGTTVSGSDDLSTSYVCGYSHTHTLACYTNQQPPLAENAGLGNRFTSLRNSISSPAEGNLYRVLYSGDSNYYNFFYCEGTWYYLGTGTGSGLYGIDADPGGPTPGHCQFVEAGTYGNCTHVCNWSCYSTQTANTSTYYLFDLPTRIADNGESPIEGCVYRNYYSGYVFNFLYLGGAWYYLGYNTEYGGVSCVDGYPSNPGTNSYTRGIAAKRSAHHTHTADCLSCNAQHTHTAACQVDTSYYEFVRADTGVTVKGDGSTVVNVYYRPKQYTLRFYYAATTGAGSDSDGDGINDTFSSVKVIGGSTYGFGNGDKWVSSVNTSDDATLLNHVFSVSAPGPVEKLPKLNAVGRSRNYTRGTLVSGATAYHYVEFSAEYGQDIIDLWPCSVFEPATRTDVSNNTNGWSGTQAFVSAWNGEHHVWYSQHNSNQTIKGKYEILDYKLLFDLSQFSDEATVSYLCFWENGAGGVNWNKPKLFVYNIWVPVLAGESTAGYTLATVDGIQYKRIDSYDTCDDSNLAEQTQPSLKGYTARNRTGDEITLTSEQQAFYMEGLDVNFYYTRNTYDLVMMNLGNTVVSKTGGDQVPYETPLASALTGETSLSGVNFAPPYPSTLEAGAYTFGGWYTTAQCLPGTEFDLSTATMPASGLILYAKWAPVDHTVNFFTTYDELRAYEEDSTSVTPFASNYVTHGETYGAVNTPTKADMIFAGWFYIENGQKKAFAPLNMPVNHDLNIFADWSSHSLQPYCVSYVLKGTDTKIADDTTGFAYAGTTRTFDAKVGDPYNQLYTAYNNGYFPTVSSHSITVQQEGEQGVALRNTFSFAYVEASNIAYTIRYLDRETGLPLSEAYNGTSTKAVLTERFKPIANYIPDSFYKRLVLEVKEDPENPDHYIGTENNVITFYYVKNSTSAFYAVHFMLEKPNATAAQKAQYYIDGSGGYEETGSSIEGIGPISNTTPIRIAPQEFAGFTPFTDHAKISVGGVEQADTANYDAGSNRFALYITREGSELYIFYQRENYPYRVHYYLYNTTTSLNEDATGHAPYESMIPQDPRNIEGYTCVNPARQNITIHDTEASNTIIFYYRPNEYMVDYVAVTDEEGLLSLPRELVSGSANLVGSVPTPKPNCEFVGWYTDPECSQPVTAANGAIDNATKRFTPNKNSLSRSETGTYYGVFYAKFVKLVGDLTIQRTGAAESNQVFVYEVRSVEDSDYVIYVTVTGNTSVTIHDLPLGDYTVTQQNGWSWRYTDASQPVAHNTDGTTVTFGQSEQTNQWLNGNSTIVPNQRGS